MLKAIPYIVLLLGSLSFLPPASGLLITDPENVTYMAATVTQSGRLKLNSISAFSLAEELRLILYVPQNDSRQTTSITRVMGPNSYRMGKDEYGNAQIILEWESPPLDRDIDYLVEASVKVGSGSSRVVRNFEQNPLVRPSAGIIESAYMVAGGQSSVEKMLTIGAWVKDHVEYDLAYEEVTLSADWVHEHARGTCDEYSNLLTSMLGVLGYNAWYAAGYAYLGGRQAGSDSFGAHAWVEAEFGGETYSIDPTWGESPVDATHITMARLPDSNFTELTEAKSRDIAMSWEKDDTRVQLLDFLEGPRIGMELEVVPQTVTSGKNVLIMADLLADGCVLSVLSLRSCVNADGSSLVDIAQPKKPVVFCGKKTMHWLAQAPVVNAGVVYTCPISASAGGGRRGDRLSISFGKGSGIEMDMSTQKILVPGQSLDVALGVRNSGFGKQELRIFTVLDNRIREKQLSLDGKGSGNLRFDLSAPQNPGKYTLTAFSSSGDMLVEEITIISARQIRITEIALPGSVELEESKTINVSLMNFGDPTSGVLRIAIGDHEDSRTVTMGANSSKNVGFLYSPETPGEKSVSITLLDSDGAYQDAWVGHLRVSQAPSFKESVSSMLEDFISWLSESIRNLFGL